jgi:hypothetical protein
MDLAPVAPEERALIPKGEYVWACERAVPGPGWEDRQTGRRRRVLYLHGPILHGRYCGTWLFLPLPITSRQSSRFYESWTVAMMRKPVRGERMRFNVFERKAFLVGVRLVTRDGFGRLRAPTAHYSVIAALVELLGTHEAWSLPHTGNRKPHTEDHIPPTPWISSSVESASEAVLASAGGRIGVGLPEPGAAETAGGRPLRKGRAAPSTPQDELKVAQDGDGAHLAIPNLAHQEVETVAEVKREFGGLVVAARARHRASRSRRRENPETLVRQR